MDKYTLLKEFLQTWPIERLRTMSIEEYTNLNKKDSFCYWLEQRTNELGGITGGSSFKFGIYKRNNTEKEISTSNSLTDGEYAWFEKYGYSRDVAFQNVRNIIVQIAEFATNKEFDKIEEIDLGEATKWKIAFMYSDFQLINTFSKDMVFSILDFLNIEYSYDESRFSLSNKILSQKKEEEDFFEFGSKFWNVTLISQELKKILENLGERLIPYFDVMDRIVEDFNLEPNNEKYYFNYRNKGLIFTIGQRYIWNVTKNEYIYISLTKDEEKFETFGRENQLPDAYLNYSKNPENFSLIYERMSKCIKNELEGTLMASHRNKNKKDLQELVFNKDFRNKVFESLNISKRISSSTSIQHMNKILSLLNFKKQIILQGPPGTGKTREAKLIAKEMLGLQDVKDLEENEQFNIIQFHPSYTYEDFVRGIVTESKGDKIEYKSVNKTLGLFAEKALKNYIDSKKETSTITKEIWLEEQFNLFVDKIAEELNNEKYFKLTDSVNIVDLEEDAFLYIGPNWKGTQHRMLFKDIKQAFLDNNKLRKDLSTNINITGSARQHATYYVKVLQEFIEFIKNKSIPKTNTVVEEKSFVLIIDEINRANLSSVLGELIYALEYRGKALDSMYEVDGVRKLILPPNLYIIGTMNTADRSVGHIDYAIRRRFAFVDVLPKDLSNEEGIHFDTSLFQQVSSLFDRNLSPEFEKKDVQLGHSYFIQKKEKDNDGNEILIPHDFSIRLDYEIKPILLEYARDGVLIGDDIKQKIENLEVTI